MASDPVENNIINVDDFNSLLNYLIEVSDGLCDSKFRKSSPYIQSHLHSSNHHHAHINLISVKSICYRIIILKVKNDSKNSSLEILEISGFRRLA